MCPTSVFWGSWWASQYCGHRKEDISSALLSSLKILCWVVVPQQGCAQAAWMGRWCQMSLSCLIQEGMNRKRKCFSLLVFLGTVMALALPGSLLWPLSCSSLWQGCWFSVDSQPEPTLNGGMGQAEMGPRSPGRVEAPLSPTWLWGSLLGHCGWRSAPLLSTEGSRCGICPLADVPLVTKPCETHSCPSMSTGEDCAAEAGDSKKVATSPSLF